MTSLAGSFLVAKSVLQDSNFAQTVVLLLQHGPEGALGLVVNREASAEGLPFPVFVGGPCESQGLFMLHGHAEWAEPSDEEGKGRIAPGIFLGDATCAGRVADPPEGQTFRFRMFAGYSGWGPDQLERELAAGAWSVTRATGELLFDTPPAELWDRLAPPTIPQPSVN
jgi:putative transcriptional regulator